MLTDFVKKNHNIFFCHLCAVVVFGIKFRFELDIYDDEYPPYVVQLIHSHIEIFRPDLVCYRSNQVLFRVDKRSLK